MSEEIAVTTEELTPDAGRYLELEVVALKTILAVVVSQLAMATKAPFAFLDEAQGSSLRAVERLTLSENVSADVRGQIVGLVDSEVRSFFASIVTRDPLR